MQFIVLEHDFVMCNLESLDEVSIHDEYCFISKIDFEFSLVCTTRYTPSKYLGIQKNLKGIRFVNVDVNQSSIAKISALLTLNDINLFTISTFDSEFIFIKNTRLNKVIDILTSNDFEDITD